MAKGDQIKGFLGNFIKQFFKNEPSEYNKAIFEKANNTEFIKSFKELNKEVESGFLNKGIGFYTGYSQQLKVNPKSVSGRIYGEFNKEITELSSKLKVIKANVINIKSNEDEIKSLTQQIADLEKKANDVPAQTNNNVKAPAQTNNNVKKNYGRKNGRKNGRNNKSVNNTTNEQPNYINDIDELKNEIKKNINQNNEFKQSINELLKGKLFKKGSQISNEATSEDIQKIIDESENFIDLFKPENQHKKVEAQFDWIIQFDYEQSKASERVQVQAGRISKTVAKVVVTQSIPQIMNGTQSFLSGKDKEQEYPQFGVMGQPMSYRDKLIRMVGNATQGV